MKKRLAVLIAAAMLITSMPFYAFAGDDAVTDEMAGLTEVDADKEIVTENGEPAVTKDVNDGTEGGSESGTVEGGDTEGGSGSGNEGEEPGSGEGGDPDTGDDPVPGEDPVVVHDPGWNEDHTAYYNSKGVALANTVKKIDGVLCYFNAAGVYDTSKGWKKTPKGKYYIKKGKIVTAPTKIKKTSKSKRYYNKKTKKWQKKKISGAKTKYVTVTKKNLYMFQKNGKLKTTKGLFKYKGKEYYGLGKGRLHTGWKAITEKKKHKAVYFKKGTGAMVKNKKVGHLKIPKSGRLGEAYYLGIKRLDKIGWDLRAAFRWSARMTYQGRSYRARNSETYAVKGFSKGYGNCYCMAATFYIMAKLMGYDVHQVQGKVDLPHSWTVIRQNGREWVYDPNFTNETGRNGWKIYYGKKGTWKYNHYHKMN